MKDKTQKSFRRIARILLLVFCYAFGSHAFALALEHEQTVEIYKVTDVPNPRNESSSNWAILLKLFCVLSFIIVLLTDCS